MSNLPPHDRLTNIVNATRYDLRKTKRTLPISNRKYLFTHTCTCMHTHLSKCLLAQRSRKEVTKKEGKKEMKKKVVQLNTRHSHRLVPTSSTRNELSRLLFSRLPLLFAQSSWTMFPSPPPPTLLSSTNQQDNGRHDRMQEMQTRDYPRFQVESTETPQKNSWSPAKPCQARDTRHNSGLHVQPRTWQDTKQALSPPPCLPTPPQFFHQHPRRHRQMAPLADFPWTFRH